MPRKKGRCTPANLCRFLWIIVFLLTQVVPPAFAADGDAYEVIGAVSSALSSASRQSAKYGGTAWGNAMADATRAYLESDVAIINGGDLTGYLPPGEITYADLRQVFNEDRALATVSVTVPELCAILEAGVSHIRLDEAERIDAEASAYDGFPQVSGLTLYYDATGPLGSRVREIRIDGVKLDLDDESYSLTLAATSFMLGGGYGLPPVEGAVESGMRLSDVTARFIREGLPAGQWTGSRIRPMGVSESILSGAMPLLYILAPVLFILAVLVGNSKARKRERENILF